MGLGVQTEQHKHPGVVIHLANNTYCFDTKTELVEFYHAAAGWPVKKTWIAAIQQNAYASWPGLDKYMVQKHLTVHEPTVLGHMNTRQSGTQSTKKKTGIKEMEIILAAENATLAKPVPGIL